MQYEPNGSRLQSIAGCPCRYASLHETQDYGYPSSDYLEDPLRHVQILPHGGSGIASASNEIHSGIISVGQASLV